MTQTTVQVDLATKRTTVITGPLTTVYYGLCSAAADQIGCLHEDVLRLRLKVAERDDRIKKLEAAINKADDHPLVMAQGGTDGIDRCHRVINKLAAENERLRQRVADLEAILRQFGDINIPDNWPGHCKLRIDTGRDGHEHISYHGVPEQHLGILPQICYWRQAREAAKAAGGEG